MTSKANNHPLVKDLRRILDKHGFQCAVLVAIDDRGMKQAATAGRTVALCNAIGPVLKESEINQLAYEMDVRIMEITR